MPRGDRGRSGNTAGKNLMDTTGRLGPRLPIEQQLRSFSRDGFLLVPGLATVETATTLRELSLAYAREGVAPIEYEADLGYPGAPPSREVVGGDTIRRVLSVYDRHTAFQQWAGSEELLQYLRAMLGRPLVLSRAHHNCVMIKDTKHSSRTPWHQDIRYWRFERPDLVSVLLALNPADEQNGCMSFVPGSHLLNLERNRFDEELSLLEDLPENQALIGTARSVPMQTGDVVFFHSRTLHAAGLNRSARPRISLLFSFRQADNLPLPGTRSASLPGVPLE